MKHKFELCLSGYGYLNNIFRKDKIIVARICWTSLDVSYLALNEITLECEVDNLALMSALDPPNQARLAGHEVYLRFSAIYTGLGFYYMGLTPEDPEHMLRLLGRLTSVEAWYRDGVLVPSIIGKE
jgi:hypothetical protein